MKKGKVVFIIVICFLLILGVGIGYVISTKINASSSNESVITTNVKGVGKEVLISLTNNKDNSGLYTIIRSADSTLQIGATESVTEYRYRGANPKNYVSFNNEVWRIIGVFQTDDGNGNIENRIKIIRNDVLQNPISWNGCTSYTSVYEDGFYIDKCKDSNAGKNNFNISLIKDYLNVTYISSLSSETQNMIGDTKYYLGGYNSSLITPVEMYTYERKISGSDYYYGTNPNSFTGKIGLMYASDYGYASANCETKKLYDTETTDLRACNDTNWLYNEKEREWLLNQYSHNSETVYIVIEDGSITNNEAPVVIPIKFRPVLYLRSEVKITGGSGTVDDMYTLGL